MDVPPLHREARGDPGPSSLAGLRILVVDDGLDNQALFGLHLSKRGAVVTAAEDGLQGYEAATQADDAGTPFDVVLMDMQMPVLDGYGATARLRLEGYEGPIVALTAHSTEAERKRCLAAGCDDFVTKPVSPEELEAAVLRNLARF